MNLKTFVTALVLACTTFIAQATSPATGKGALTSPDSIRTQIIEHLEEADICTKTWMDTEARIHFVVDEAGQIQVVGVETKDETLKNCITRKLNTSQLAIPRQGRTQSYSINVNFRVV